ncbi:unnamed protein product [Blepharisma stoltei]|uniref:Myb-like DNA-binding domain containing protein n=1 Tax=Blepharisma stoltei TaxID=1481888 RepID=A0AAU9KF33_9CILI|nr:unnamed protein product [Blepharisma stoltei]
MESNNKDNSHQSLLSPYKIDDEIWMVPCKLDGLKHKYSPLIYPRVLSGNLKHPWTKKEDDIVISLLNTQSYKKWTIIAKAINKQIHNEVPVRNGKQCRERWHNHLNPKLKKGDWTYEEDQIIIEKQQEIGNKWSIIANFLPGRTENNVKNRWKSILRRSKRESLKPLISATGASNVFSSKFSQREIGKCQEAFIGESEELQASFYGLDELDPIDDVALTYLE